jgi:hypothetical protein
MRVLTFGFISCSGTRGFADFLLNFLFMPSCLKAWAFPSHSEGMCTLQSPAYLPPVSLQHYHQRFSFQYFGRVHFVVLRWFSKPSGLVHLSSLVSFPVGNSLDECRFPFFSMFLSLASSVKISHLPLLGAQVLFSFSSLNLFPMSCINSSLGWF